MKLTEITLEDRYLLDSGTAYLTGIQALVRLALNRRARDAALGLDTAGFVSGYRGSPLGALDQELWRNRGLLEQRRIRFQPGINEDLAATAVWGTQQVELFPGARHAGVFSMWYGKGPGLDRSSDVFKHANAAGTSPHGGVLAISGDDHGCKSSTLPSQSEYTFMDVQMPVLNPAGVQEVLDLGLIGWAMSRHSGCWVGLKAIADTMDSAAVVDVDPHRVSITVPPLIGLAEGGLHARWPDSPLEQELRLQRDKLYAALEFARVNRLDRVVIDSPNPRIGIVTTGKSYLDVRQALDDLGIDEAMAADIGLRVYKVAMSWPLEREGVRRFAEGLEEVLVIEEKRALIENQLKEQLYNWNADVRPAVTGKFDASGQWILPSSGELSPARIARVIATRLARFVASTEMRDRLRFLERKELALARALPTLARTPHFCSGCPHSRSTVVPEGSRALGGIGCHYMATWMDRGTETFTQMGGEGATWIGQSPFTDTSHVFVNLGDGTYFHSGLLAIRAAVAAGVNITYKLLYNDAVAMTGGQPIDGSLSVRDITHQLRSEGVGTIHVVSEDPSRHRGAGALADGVAVHPREALARIQRELRTCDGVSVIVYDQTCAAEKRRRRKRGTLAEAPARPFINEAVCEGCGDCSVRSNCLSVVPVETPLGRKRAIDQSGCNVDLSCLDGFCPSFVTVRGARPRRPASATRDPDVARLAVPMVPELEGSYDIVLAGIGGTGVTTLAAMLGVAAHLEGKGVTVLDMTGLAQKFGAVTSHVRIARHPTALHAARIAAGNADLVLGCDLVVAASFDVLAKCDGGHTHAVVNAHQSMTAAFLRDPDLAFPAAGIREAIGTATRGRATFVDAQNLARALLGDTVTANVFLLGIAWQRGLVPLGATAIEHAIELNAVAVESNLRAFRWGRRWADDPHAVEAEARGPAVSFPVRQTLEALIDDRAAHLQAYQDARLAHRYRELVERVRQVETARVPGSSALARAVATGYAHLLAYKDEYEVARLYASNAFRRQLEETFDAAGPVTLYLAPGFLSRTDPATGRPAKRAFGPWILPLLGVLARLRFLRGTAFDPFARSRDRRLERALIVDYEALTRALLEGLTPDNVDVAVDLAGLARTIRGFGPVKEAAAEQARGRREALLARFRAPPPRKAA